MSLDADERPSIHGDLDSVPEEGEEPLPTNELLSRTSQPGVLAAVETKSAVRSGTGDFGEHVRYRGENAGD
jgi:hypothetical protein